MFDEPFGSYLFIFNKNLHKYLNNKILKFDLNYIQMLFLIRINSDENINQKDLADIFFLTKGYVTKAIKDLEDKSFITRHRDSQDKRQYYLKLTDKSLELLPVFKDIKDQWEEKMGLKDIDDDFFITFKELVDKSIELNKEDN